MFRDERMNHFCNVSIAQCTFGDIIFTVATGLKEHNGDLELYWWG